MPKYLFKDSYLSVFQNLRHSDTNVTRLKVAQNMASRSVLPKTYRSLNPRLPEPFFVTRLPKGGGGYHPLLDFRY